jgi:ketosteroid isomerase-like protein
MGNINDNGKYMTVWEKQSDGSWKVKAETWNSDNNPWADMNMDEMDSDQ